MPTVPFEKNLRKKTILNKYLAVSTAILFCSFAILGSFLLVFVSNFWEEDKKQVLEQNARLASDYISSAQLSVDTITGEVKVSNRGELINALYLFAQFNNADFIFTDQTGNIISAFRPFWDVAPEDLKVPESMWEVVLREGQYSGSGTMGNLFSTQQYIVGLPVTYTFTPTSPPTVVGQLFVSIDAQNLGLFRQKFIQIFLIAAILGSLVSFLAIWMLTYRMVQPLREMSAAARRFGNGDFSRRIPVYTEDEIGQLALSLNNMAGSLSIGENMRRSFIANVSHELKTPMTTIAGFIDGILDGTIPADRQPHYLNIVSDEVKRLSRLVRSMLDLTRIDSGELTLTRSGFELSSILLNTALLFEQKINEKSLDIQGLDTLKTIHVNGDHDMIHQVVYNLMENAVKFTPKHGFIRLGNEEKGNRVYASITNSCEGLAPEELPLIFDRFYKTDHSRSQDKNGIGLGLYLAKTIVRLHGGEISAQIADPNAVTFTFWLPKGKDAKPKQKRLRAEDTGDIALPEPADVTENPSPEADADSSLDSQNYSRLLNCQVKCDSSCRNN